MVYVSDDDTSARVLNASGQLFTRRPSTQHAKKKSRKKGNHVVGLEWKDVEQHAKNLEKKKAIEKENAKKCQKKKNTTMPWNGRVPEAKQTPVLYNQNHVSA